MASKEEGVGEGSVMNKGMEIRRDLELLEKIQDKEERLRALLSPAESYIIWFQKILVWEHPYLTVALLLVVNILFWLGTTWRIYCLIGLTGMVAVALEMWVSYVWSETSGNGSGVDDTESWTEVYPRLLGVPELSSYLARWWVSGLQWLDSAISLRAENHAKFFVYSLFFLTCFAVIGMYIPGIYFSYFSVMGLLLWPSLSYHNIIGRLRQHIDPIIERMEQKLNIKRRRNKKSGKRRSRRRKQEAADDESDSDRDIEEFIPPADSLIMTTLTKASTLDPSGGDEDEDSASYTPSEFTPRMPSQAESHDHTDDELLSEEISLLARDVKEMPSIDDPDVSHSDTQMFLPQRGGNNETESAENFDRLLNISDDEDDDHEQPFLNAEMPRNLAEADRMTFVTSHFKESSDEEDEEERGLSFSDLPDVMDAEVEVKSSESESKVLGVIGGLISQSHSSLVAAFRSPVVSQTMSSVMSNTLTGLGVLRSTVASMTGQDAASGATGEVPLLSDAVTAGSSAGAAEGANSRSAELQVLESEFEFLEQEELDSMDGGK